MSDESLRELREVQAFFRLPSVGLVEKDLHVVRAIAALAAADVAPFHLVFGGGRGATEREHIVHSPYTQGWAVRTATAAGPAPRLTKRLRQSGRSAQQSSEKEAGRR